MKKHAYLIMAHNQFELLENLLTLLDHENHCFYVHIDKKVKNAPLDKIKECVKKSKIEFCEPLNVNWGGYSQIQCEMNLLKQAVKGKYDHYHLLSGVDIPLKTNEEILDFFEKSPQVQYVHFCDNKIQNVYLERMKTFYFFQEGARKSRCCYRLGRISRKIQNMLKVDRLKRMPEEIQFGANWFSITHEFAEYVVTKEKWVRKHFKYTICADELFLQTLLVNSKFKNELLETAYNGSCSNCLRHIDWERGNPYVFRTDDFEELVSSPCLFARKFDLNVDKDIIEKMKNYLNERGKRNETKNSI